MGAVRGDALPCCPTDKIVQGKADGKLTEGEVEMDGTEEVVSSKHQRRGGPECKVCSQINQQRDGGISSKHSQLSAVA